MKRKFLTILMIFVLVFSFSPASFASAGDNEASTYSTFSVSYGIDRTSASKADVYVHTVFNGIVDSFNVVVYLQKYENGAWDIDFDHPEYVYYNNGFKKRIFTFYNEYSNLERGVQYRIKCVSKTHVGETVYRLTSYSDPF